MTSPIRTKLFYRGRTIFWVATFYDEYCNVVQPIAAYVNVVFSVGGVLQTVLRTMSPVGGGSVTWMGNWDSRGTDPGEVYWSVHSSGGPPVTVGDGDFILTANPANLITFA